MIENPVDPVMFIVALFSLIIGGTVSFVLIYKSNSEIWIIPISIGAVMMIVVSVFMIMPSHEEYQNEVQIEIDNSSCDELVENYYLYDSEEIKEKIKSKYIFDCVPDKGIWRLL